MTIKKMNYGEVFQKVNKYNLINTQIESNKSDPMKDKFSEYYRPDLLTLWGNCHFVFDTNVLLDLYYNKNLYEQFVEILEEKIFDKIWMPYQVGLEFHKHCFNPVKDKEIRYYEYVGHIKGQKKVIKKSLQKLCENSHVLDLNEFMDMNDFLEHVEKLNEILDQMVKIMGENHDFFAGDHVRNKLDTLFKGKIGDNYPEDKLKEIYKEGKERYANKIPPGFKDDKYGDLIIWHQIMDYAKEKNKHVIFITHDTKVDWWFKTESGHVIGPHPYLIKEFRSKTNQEVYLYKFSDFLKNANSLLGADFDSETIEDVEEREEFTELANELEEIGEPIIPFNPSQVAVQEARRQMEMTVSDMMPSLRLAAQELKRQQEMIISSMMPNLMLTAQELKRQQEMTVSDMMPSLRLAAQELKRQQEMAKAAGLNPTLPLATKKAKKKNEEDHQADSESKGDNE